MKIINQIKRLLLFLVIFSYSGQFLPISGLVIYGQSEKDTLTLSKINDGPYVFLRNDHISVKWIENGKVDSLNLKKNNFDTPELERRFKYLSKIIAFQNDKKCSVEFNEVKKIAVLSDIHGQFDLFQKILFNNNIIDTNFNWAFGEGHLVIIGDVFDRGPKVTETLWLILKLEMQAAATGGAVHYTLGNHDLMIINRDLRYINEKYKITCNMLGMDYTSLFGQNSLIGKWLREKKVVMSINDILFNHAGISKKIIENKLSIEDINKLFKEKLFDSTKEIIYADSLSNLLYRGDGPIWYRGYFKDESFTIDDLDSILDFYKKNRIIVGHSSMKEILSYFNGKLYVVDSSIKNGENGEVFFILDGNFWRGTKDGVRMKIKEGSR